jgi:uncharacterized membrane protein
MDPTFLLNLFMRWLHVAAAVIGVGGTVIMRFAVLPALAAVPNGEEILEQIRAPFKRLIHASLGIVLLTGFYNYLAVTSPRAAEMREQGVEAFRMYHSVMGVKILLSLALFAIAIVLLKPVPSFHANRKSWLSVNVVLGMAILLLGAYLRRLW